MPEASKRREREVGEKARARVAGIEVVLEWLLKRLAKSRSILSSAAAAPKGKKKEQLIILHNYCPR